MYKFLSSFGIKECISESVAFIDMMQTAHSKEFVYLNPRGNINLVNFRGHDNFGAAHGWGGWGQKCPLPKICHTYPTIMKLGTVIPYPKEIQKIYESLDTPLEFC